MSMRTIELGMPITDAAVDAKTHDDLLHAGNPESALQTAAAAAATATPSAGH